MNRSIGLEETIVRYIKIMGNDSRINVENKEVYDRFFALHHLFMTIGNGYVWGGGGLVYFEHASRYIQKKDDSRISKFLNMKMEDAINIFGDSNELDEYIKSTIDGWVKNRSKNIIDMHSDIFWDVCTLSKIFDIPKNIKTDWLDGIIELCWYLMAGTYPNTLVDENSDERWIYIFGDTEMDLTEKTRDELNLTLSMARRILNKWPERAKAVAEKMSDP